MVATTRTSTMDILGRPAGEASRIPITIRSNETLGAVFKDVVRTRLARHLRHEGMLVKRATVRFEDVNGPKGGVDKVCRIKLVLAHLPPIVVEKADTSEGPAFAKALAAVEIAARRLREKRAALSL